MKNMASNILSRFTSDDQRSSRSEVAVSCDGCAALFTAPTATAAAARMYHQRWRISGVNHGW